MKKVLILQNNGKSYGGVWQVNKLIGEELIKNNYQVSIVSIRNNQNNLIIEHDERLKLYTINEKDDWGTYKGSQIIGEIKKLHFFNAIKMVVARIEYDIILLFDIKKLHKFIYEYNPNYIITSHYQLINMIPKKYLNITMHEQHSSLKNALEHKATKKAFYKYKDKIKFIFLTKQSVQYAKNEGINNCTYIYNAVRFNSNEVADVINNKKLITIARLSKDKDIMRMVSIAKEIFNDQKYSDWVLEIYGNGSEYENIKKAINNHKQIKLMGLTDNPKDKLLSASINLNTSPYEGFCLSILEANECGVPTITFNFGESVTEEILDGKTGIIATDYNDYVNKLKQLMDDNNKLQELANNCKEFNKNFQIDEIIKKWLLVFSEIDKQNENKK